MFELIRRQLGSSTELPSPQKFFQQLIAAANIQAERMSKWLSLFFS
jgi:hypothetical protein